MIRTPFTWESMPHTLQLGVVWAVALASAALGGPAPALSGPYKGELGVVEFQVDEGRVSGFYEAGGACDFAPGRRVIEGQFEGNVLVGSVTLCQVGAECKERVLPFAAFYNAQDRGLTADVKLPAGCSSPALRNARLTLAPSEKAAQGRRKPFSVKKNAELARSALSAGHRLLEAHQYEEAAQQFEIGLSYDERNWLAYLGLGVAEMRRGNVHKAMDSLERSRDLAKAQRQDDASIYYNIACGHSRLGNKEAALASLAMAIKRGFALPEAMSADPDLKTLAGEGEFKKLLNKAWEQKNKQGQTAKRGGDSN